MRDRDPETENSDPETENSDPEIENSDSDEVEVRDPDKLDLRQFQHWLVSDGKSHSTAEVYRALVRGLFRSSVRFLNSAISDPEHLQRLVVEHDEALTGSSRAMFRTAVRHFARYLKVRNSKLVLPELFPDGRRAVEKKKRRERKKHPTSDHLRYFHERKMKFWELERVRWKDVARVKNDVTKGEIRMNDTLYIVPIETLRQLSLWAGGGLPARPEQPLVPAEPGSDFPMSPQRMRRIATRC